MPLNPAVSSELLETRTDPAEVRMIDLLVKRQKKHCANIICSISGKKNCFVESLFCTTIVSVKKNIIPQNKTAVILN